MAGNFQMGETVRIIGCPETLDGQTLNGQTGTVDGISCDSCGIKLSTPLNNRTYIVVRKEFLRHETGR